MKTLTQIASALATGLLLACSSALADVTSVAGTVAPGTVSPAQAGSVSIRWQAVVTPNAVGGPETVSSSSGHILAPDGTPLIRLATVFNRTGVGTFTFNESALIPAATVQSWRAAGYNLVTIQRVFSATNGPDAIGITTLALADATGAATSPLLDARTPTANLVIRNLELRFRDTLAPIAVVTPDSDLKAELRVYHSGTGTFEGEWQVAEPGSTEGQPIYRPLQRVRQLLTGQQLSVLTSPALPTRVAGKYLLRFCAIDAAAVTASAREALCTVPETTAQTVYQVLADEQNAVKALQVLSPRTAAVTPASRFEWAPVPGTVVYQLQVFSVDDGMVTPAFVTGMLLPSNQVQTALSAIMTQHLKNGGRYLWRISALDQSGRVIGRSSENSFTFTHED